VPVPPCHRFDPFWRSPETVSMLFGGKCGVEIAGS
jgi:hypothetical protein